MYKAKERISKLKDMTMETFQNERRKNRKEKKKKKQSKTKQPTTISKNCETTTNNISTHNGAITEKRKRNRSNI
jgi:hypothetical protein